MDVTSYLLGKKAGGGTPINNQNKDITVTENGTTTVSADAGYTGLGTVGVTTNVQPDLESKSITITENGTTTITPTTGKDGLSEVEVTTSVPTSGPDLSEYFRDTIRSGDSYKPGFIYTIKKLPSTLTLSGIYLSYAFARFNGTEIPHINGDMSQVTSLANMFYDSFGFETLDLSYFNTSNVTEMQNMFDTCQSLKNLNISSFDFGKVENIDRFLYNPYLGKIENLTFGYDLGKGYLTTASANYSHYKLALNTQPKLSHDSLMSVINGLYDIASAGVQSQQLVLGATNLAKLTAEEIAIATAKGWTVS